MRALIVNESGAQRAVGAAELDELTDPCRSGPRRHRCLRGDAVLVRLGKSLEWLVAMRALWRIGAVSLPCPELLTDERRGRPPRALGRRADAARAGRPAARRCGTAGAASSAADAPAFVLFTSGTEGGPKGALHRRGYVEANRLQTERWMGVRPGDRVWCTAATGWSKSLRNAWLAAELAGAETVLHAAGSMPPSDSS